MNGWMNEIQANWPPGGGQHRENIREDRRRSRLSNSLKQSRRNIRGSWEEKYTLASCSHLFACLDSSNENRKYLYLKQDERRRYACSSEEYDQLDVRRRKRCWRKDSEENGNGLWREERWKGHKGCHIHKERKVWNTIHSLLNVMAKKEDDEV